MSVFNFFTDLQLTNDQTNALKQISSFIDDDNDVFILKGYAGSGKTTLIKGIVEYLVSIEIRYLLMAPTGRAAKVIQEKTNTRASTIHRGIYNFEKLFEDELDTKQPSGEFVLYFNVINDDNVIDNVIIIDEASMVSDNNNSQEFIRFGSGFLLRDLIQFSKIKNRYTRTKIIFVGDPAQLPPVGMSTSPALDKDYLMAKYNLNVQECEMSEVKRQLAENGVRKAAAIIRRGLTSGFMNYFDLKDNSTDIFSFNDSDFLKKYFINSKPKIVLSWKNETALDLNRQIRNHLFGTERDIQTGDKVIIGANNYSLDIMNGEFAVVNNVYPEKIIRNITLYKRGGGKAFVKLVWQKINLFFPFDNKTVESYMLENYLLAKSNLLPEERQALYVDFKKRNPGLNHKSEAFRKLLKTDPFVNAIKLKYGYAITVHKAQGGEWDSVFVFWDRVVKSINSNQSVTAGISNSDFFRWAYTAITRTSDKLFNNNAPSFTPFSNIAFIDVKVNNPAFELTGRKNIVKEISFDNEDYRDIEKFGLQDSLIELQEHLIKVKYIAVQLNAEITDWQKKGNYEFWYKIERGDKSVGIKFWIDGKNKVKNKFMKNPKQTNSDSLFSELSEKLNELQNIIVTGNIVQDKVVDIEFDKEIEERKPFLKALFDIFKDSLKSENIRIGEIIHREYSDYYKFYRNNETAAVTFHYDKKGLFSTVVPNIAGCNSSELLDEIRKVVINLKNNKYVV
jgi:hypothetical protein